jgi:hypothetical protein
MQLRRRVVAAMQRCRSEGSGCKPPGRGGRRNLFDVSKERVLVHGKCRIHKWQLTPGGIFNRITSPDLQLFLYTEVLNVFAGAPVYLKSGEPDVDTNHELKNPGSWLQVTRLVKDTEMFRFGSLPASPDGSYSRSRYELENKCFIHSGCVVVVSSLVELFVEFDCCVNCSRVAWLVAARKFL